MDIQHGLFVLMLIFGNANKLVNSQYFCACDLQSDVCEVNCCCDEDCTNAQLEVFKICIDTPKSSNDVLMCTYNSISYADKNQPQENTTYSSRLLCLTKSNDNSEAYQPPDCAETDCFSAANSLYSFTVEDQNRQFPTQSYSNDDYLTASFNGTEGYFTVPLPFNGLCKDNPIKYLEDYSASCLRQVTNSSCLGDSSLSPSTYYDNILIDFGRTPVTLVSCILSSTDVNCTSFPAEDASGCLGIVKSVAYTVLTTRVGQISNVSCEIELTNFVTLDSAVRQEFSVKFITANTNEFVKLSGNPGYDWGKPLIPVTYDPVNKSVKTYYEDESAFSILSVDSTGMCNASIGLSRSQLLFGIDQQAQCALYFNADTLCQTLLDFAVVALESLSLLSTNEDEIYVAAFGNFTPPESGPPFDVVPLVRAGALPTYDSVQTVREGCPGMIVGSRFTVLYTKVGSSSDPQRLVVGFKYEYESAASFTLACFDSFCFNCTQRTEVVQSVSYVDVSQPPSSVSAYIIPIEIPFPEDFLFPFYTAASTRTFTHSPLLVFMCICFIFFTVYTIL